jgi:tRNA (guanine-N7-)-methyltransferase
MTLIDPSKLKPIRSYVLRQGRMSPRQQRGFELGCEPYQIKFDAKEIDFSQVFQRDAETVLEIGFGMGRSLLQMAKAAPETNFLGLEVHMPGVGALLADLMDENLSNVRVISHDAVEVFKTMLTPGSLNRVQIFFPDPWPKKRHHKRRLIQESFVTLIADKLKQGGVLHLATDCQDYAEQMMQVLTAQASFVNKFGPGCFAPADVQRPLTKYENRGQRLGNAIWDLLFIRSSDN